MGRGREAGLPLALVGPPTPSVNTDHASCADNATSPLTALESISEAVLSRMGRGSS